MAKPLVQSVELTGNDKLCAGCNGRNSAYRCACGECFCSAFCLRKEWDGPFLPHRSMCCAEEVAKLAPGQLPELMLEARWLEAGGVFRGVETLETIIGGDQGLTIRPAKTTPCQVCGRTAAQARIVKLLSCSACRAAWYCGRECQKIDWRERGHKAACKKKNELEP